MTTTTDETTHLRALLAEQTARAERAEAEIAAAYGALTMIDTGGTGTLADRVNDLRALWVRAEAANAELRAALEEAFAIHQRSECAAPPCTCTGFEATRALLSRPDLGRGMVVEREVLERSGGRIKAALDDIYETWVNADEGGARTCDEATVGALKAVLVDLDALLNKKVGG